MASLYPKKIGGNTYWYLREMARVHGRPQMVSERYLGTAAEIEALLDARESATPWVRRVIRWELAGEQQLEAM